MVPDEMPLSTDVFVRSELAPIITVVLNQSAVRTMEGIDSLNEMEISSRAFVTAACQNAPGPGPCQCASSVHEMGPVCR